MTEIQISQYNASEYIKHSAPQTQRGLSLIKLAKVADGDVILDVGCGDGRTTLNLFKSNPNVDNIVGVDISKDQIKAANALAQKPENEEFRRKVAFRNMDFANDRTLPKDHFSLAFSNTAIHWIGPEAYRNIFALLKSGGRMCVEQCAHDDLQALHDACLNTVDKMGLTSQFEGWKAKENGYWTPTEDELRSQLEGIGFASIKTTLNEFSFPQDFSDEGIYEAFIASSLHNYYEVISDKSLCTEFTKRVREEFKSAKPSTFARRLQATAVKP